MHYLTSILFILEDFAVTVILECLPPTASLYIASLAHILFLFCLYHPEFLLVNKIGFITLASLLTQLA